MHVGLVLGLAVAGLVVIAVPLANRRSGATGFERIVRCRSGHLFSSTVVPGASVKAVRLGIGRLQRCPVGHHWTIVRTVDLATLTPEQLAVARSIHDTPIP